MNEVNELVVTFGGIGILLFVILLFSIIGFFLGVLFFQIATKMAHIKLKYVQSVGYSILISILAWVMCIPLAFVIPASLAFLFIFIYFFIFSLSIKIIYNSMQDDNQIAYTTSMKITLFYYIIFIAFSLIIWLVVFLGSLAF